MRIQVYYLIIHGLMELLLKDQILSTNTFNLKLNPNH